MSAKTIGAALVILCFLAVAAVAQSTCAPADNVRTFLKETHGERLSWSGRQENGWVLEIWENEDSGSWTAVQIAGGIACVRAAGQNGPRV